MKNEKMPIHRNTKIPRILKDKKGFVFADILGAIQRAVSWFFTTVPRPVLLLIFLLFLVAFSSIFGFVLNTTGNFCDTQGNKYSTGTFSFATNLNLLLSMPSNDELNAEGIDANEQPFFDETVTECGLYVGGTGWNKTNEETDITTPIPTREYFFADSGRCTKCQTIVKLDPPSGTIVSKTKVCDDNILYPKSQDEKSFLGKITCGKFLGSCSIPEGYYWRSNDNRFICDDPLCKTEDDNTTTLGGLWNLKLKETGAKLTQYTENEKSYKNAAQVSCEPGNIEPQFTTFGVPVFNYRIWVVLFFLAALLWAVFKIKQ